MFQSLRRGIQREETQKTLQVWSERKKIKGIILERERETEREREMVGSGASDRSKEAVGMMALHEALRSVCLNSDWTYSVFWTIRPRPYVSLFVSLIPSLCLCLSLFLAFDWSCFLKSVSVPFIAEESEVVMVARLETTTAACEYGFFKKMSLLLRK